MRTVPQCQIKIYVLNGSGRLAEMLVSAVPISVKNALKLVPSSVMPIAATMAIKAIRNAYSVATAADSLFASRRITDFSLLNFFILLSRNEFYLFHPWGVVDYLLTGIKP